MLLDRMTDSIDDILTLSNNSEDLSTEVVDVSLICAEVCDAYKMNYPNLLFAFTEDQPTLIHGRDRWIYRAVSNLVDNAIKYGEGKLVIVTISNQKGSVIIEVKDQELAFLRRNRHQFFLISTECMGSSRMAYLKQWTLGTRMKPLFNPLPRKETIFQENH